MQNCKENNFSGLFEQTYKVRFYIQKFLFEYIISTLQFNTILILFGIIIREFIYNKIYIRFTYIYLDNIKS